MTRRAKAVVIDTNVPLAAHGAASVGPDCVSACAAEVERVLNRGRLVLDDGWVILNEYRANLQRPGQPGLAQAFLKWALTNHTNPSLCVRVTIHRRPGPTEDWEEFPRSEALAGFDTRDRKFVAVARVRRHRSRILQAADSKWWTHRDALKAAGVHVKFLCRAEVEAASARKSAGST